MTLLSISPVVVVSVVLLTFALIIVSATFGITASLSSSHCSDCNNTNTTTDDMCTTPSCVKLAATLLSNLNQSVDPCIDFYNFTCGGWDADNIVPPGLALVCTYTNTCMYGMVVGKTIVQVVHFSGCSWQLFLAVVLGSADVLFQCLALYLDKLYGCV